MPVPVSPILEQNAQRPSRILLDPEWYADACVYMTAHATLRLQERFGLARLKAAPFLAFTHYCEPDHVIRPVWGIPLRGGYLLGRWEETLRTDLGCKHWFVATTCITERQFQNSRLHIVKSIQVNVKLILDERQFLATRKF
jgi:hypothetical protein